MCFVQSKFWLFNFKKENNERQSDKSWRKVFIHEKFHLSSQVSVWKSTETHSLSYSCPIINIECYIFLSFDSMKTKVWKKFQNMILVSILSFWQFLYTFETYETLWDLVSTGCLSKMSLKTVSTECFWRLSL